MGICTSNQPKLSDHDQFRNKTNTIPTKDSSNKVKDTPKRLDNTEIPKSPFFPFYNPSPSHYLFSKKSPTRSSANSTPKWFFRQPFPPPSPTKHIRALLARRHGSVKPNEAAIPEGNESSDGLCLDKGFGFSKNFGSKYEIGEEIGRGHFGYTCKDSKNLYSPPFLGI